MHEEPVAATFVVGECRLPWNPELIAAKTSGCLFNAVDEFSWVILADRRKLVWMIRSLGFLDPASLFALLECA